MKKWELPQIEELDINETSHTYMFGKHLDGAWVSEDFSQSMPLYSTSHYFETQQ